MKLNQSIRARRSYQEVRKDPKEVGEGVASPEGRGPWFPCSSAEGGHGAYHQPREHRVGTRVPVGLGGWHCSHGLLGDLSDKPDFRQASFGLGKATLLVSAYAISACRPTTDLKKAGHMAS